MITFSVITIVWNDRVGATRTMQSVFSQTYPHYEVIVQDGASTDGTSEMLRSFGDWIDDLVIEEDDGIYDAMNRALARATGDYLIFMNAADYFLKPDVLERVAQMIDPEKDDIFVGQALSAETGRVHQYRKPHEFWAGSTTDHQATFIRRELMQELKYSTEYDIAGDLHFFTRARKRGAFFRYEPIAIAKKPFAVGASSGFVDRVRDRLTMLEEAWGKEYPVREKITNEMATHLSRVFDLDANNFRDKSVEELLLIYEDWQDRLSAASALSKP
ncbi:MAG: glycosyltransferase family 2 protein [Pseudomonadota bacterium]